jgi:outer membrane protein assembly factor BamA
VAPRWRTLLLLSCVALAACASARRRVDGDLVAGIRFEGRDGGIQGVQFRSAMAQKASGPAARLPVLQRFVRPISLNRELLATDGRRVETWLAHQGWFDARVLGWRVETLRPRRYRRDGTLRKGGVVRIVGTVDQGIVSRLRELQVIFEDDLADRYWRSAQVATIRREGWVQPGAPFVLSNVDYTRATLLRNIRDLGYAYAAVDATVEAWPNQHEAEVTLRVRTGPATQRAPAEIKYEGRVREADIREVLELDERAGFRQTELTRARDRLIGLGTFAVVRVEPDLSDPSRDEVPVTVSLTDGRFGALRGGVGLVYNGVTVTPRVSTTVKHSNLDGRLARFEGGASLGAGIPIVGSWVATRMLGGVNAGVIRPRTFGHRVDTNAELSFRRDLLAGQLLFARSRALAGMSWRFTDHVVLNVGPSLEFNRLGSGSPFGGEASLSDEDRLLATATFGDGRKNPFVLALAEARVSIDWRTGAEGQDAGVDPRGGYYYVAGVRQAVPFRQEGPSSFRFTDVFAEARLYRSVLSADRSRVPITLALRVRGKWLPSLAGRDLLSAVPYAERAFLGGSLDMRGFRINQVGAYDCVCLSRDEELTRGLIWPFVSRTGVSRLRPNPIYLPRGGRVSGLVSGEVRWRTTASWGLAFFGDVGALAPSIEALAQVGRVLRWDAGLGYRQSTPVGPIRIDLAFRPSYPEDLSPIRPGEPGAGETAFRGDVFGCEPFPDARLTRRLPGLGVSPRWNGALPPVIVNLTIAIGEAI